MCSTSGPDDHPCISPQVSPCGPDWRAGIQKLPKPPFQPSRCRCYPFVMIRKPACCASRRTWFYRYRQMGSWLELNDADSTCKENRSDPYSSYDLSRSIPLERVWYVRVMACGNPVRTKCVSACSKNALNLISRLHRTSDLGFFRHGIPPGNIRKPDPNIRLRSSPCATESRGYVGYRLGIFRVFSGRAVLFFVSSSSQFFEQAFDG